MTDFKSGVAIAEHYREKQRRWMDRYHGILAAKGIEAFLRRIVFVPMTLEDFDNAIRQALEQPCVQEYLDRDCPLLDMLGRQEDAKARCKKVFGE